MPLQRNMPSRIIRSKAGKAFGLGCANCATSGQKNYEAHHGGSSSLHQLSRKPISAVPKCARRVSAPLAVIALAWTAHEPFGHNNRLHAVALRKCLHFRCELRFLPHVAVDDLPVAHLGFRVLGGNDTATTLAVRLACWS